MKPLKSYQIAKKANISAAFLSEILSGKKRPSWQTAKKLFSVTGVGAEIWLDGSPEQIRAEFDAAINKKAA